MFTQKSQSTHVLVLGAGNFGTCLAQHLASNGHQITIWSIEDDVVASINTHHRNLKYLSQAILSERIKATNRISAELLKSVGAIVLVTPTQVIRTVCEQIKPWYDPSKLLVCAAKGIEIESLELPIGIIASTLGTEAARRACFLSGPSFASEVIERQPTAVSIASHDSDACLVAQNLFHAPFFRVYSSEDPIGLEIAGAMKNVIAIASGAVAGLGYQNNSRAALLTRGLAEMIRLGVTMGANPLTFNGLGGVGDLFLTATSEKSRNYRVGYRLGSGEKVETVLNSLDSVAEGVPTAKAVRQLSKRLNVTVPICDQVYEVLYEGKSVKEAMTSLIMREPKAEH